MIHINQKHRQNLGFTLYKPTIKPVFKGLDMDIFLQVAVILICLFYGARKCGVALGLLGGIGIVIMVFVFGLPPGKPPVDVMLTIIAVVAASATLQASGGLEVLLKGAEKVLRRNPKYVSILAPFTTCTLTILCGRCRWRWCLWWRFWPRCRLTGM